MNGAVLQTAAIIAYLLGAHIIKWLHRKPLIIEYTKRKIDNDSKADISWRNMWHYFACRRRLEEIALWHGLVDREWMFRDMAKEVKMGEIQMDLEHVMKCWSESSPRCLRKTSDIDLAWLERQFVGRVKSDGPVYAEDVKDFMKRCVEKSRVHCRN